MIRARQAALLARPLGRTLPWYPAAGACALAAAWRLLADGTPAPVVVQLVAALVAIGLASAVADASAPTVAASPTPLRSRLVLRLAPAAALAAAAWLAALALLAPPEADKRSAELALLAALGIAAACWQPVARALPAEIGPAAVVLGALALDHALPGALRPLGGSPHLAGAVLAACALALLATRDPGRRRARA